VPSVSEADEGFLGPGAQPPHPAVLRTATLSRAGERGDSSVCVMLAEAGIHDAA
jgi:hypothetical protein